MSELAHADHVLGAYQLSKTFGTFRAVDEVGINVTKSSVTGLMGPNGAGKTTVLNLLSGLIRPDNGRVTFDGVDVTRVSASVRARRRLVRTFQHPRLVSELTCFENVMLGAQTPRSGVMDLVAWIPGVRRETSLVDRSATALKMVGVAESKWLRRPSAVPPQDHRWLEIARALAADPRVLLLDEPSAGFTPAEVQRLVRLIRDLTSGGKSELGVLLVTHDVSLALTLSSRIAVMDRGILIGYDVPEQIVALPRVRQAYLGTKGAELAERTLANRRP